MQKLSRTSKYRDYRNELNNDSEREIATRELRDLQEKIIFNEKRFGNSSRTETDLSRGRRDTSYDNYYNRSKHNREHHTYIGSHKDHSDDLDDIFSELNRYKNYPSRYDINDEQDDYIRRIKDIVNNAGASYDNSHYYQSNSSYYQEPRARQLGPMMQNSTYPQQPYPQQPYPQQNPVRQYPPQQQYQQPYPQQPYPQQPYPQQNPVRQYPPQQPYQQVPYYGNAYQQVQNDYYAEFVEPQQPIMQQYESQLQNVIIRKPVVKPPVPQVDHSKEFEEICANVNSLAEEIEASNSFAQDQYVPQTTNHIPDNSFEGMQQTIKKDLINSDNAFMSSLQKEVDQYNKADEAQSISNTRNNAGDEQRRVIKKSEVSGQMKQEYDNTVSLEVDKLVSEINSSKADNISAADIIQGNDIARKDISENQAGKTIAFEVNRNNISDNTIVLSQPDLDDSSIHTMSFETEELDIEADKGNTLLNIILSVLILIAVGALGVIIYFFLITRGII